MLLSAYQDTPANALPLQAFVRSVQHTYLIQQHSHNTRKYPLDIRDVCRKMQGLPPTVHPG